MTYEIVSERKGKRGVRVRQPSDVLQVLDRYRDAPQEQFIVVTLNGAHEVLSVRIASIGLVNRTLVHPREIFREAIRDNAVAVIVAHNHPSGNRTRELSELLGVHPVTIRKWLSAGNLPHYRFGSAIRFDAAEVLAVCRRDGEIDEWVAAAERGRPHGGGRG